MFGILPSPTKDIQCTFCKDIFAVYINNLMVIKEKYNCIIFADTTLKKKVVPPIKIYVALQKWMKDMRAEAHQPKLGLSLKFLVDFYSDWENISR